MLFTSINNEAGHNNTNAQSDKMAKRALTDIKTHNETPRIMGFHPADFILSSESPAPIRKRVRTSKDLDIVVIPCVITSGMGR